jgi:phage major head subunit gpT-like protein
MGMADLGSRGIIGRIFLALEETQPPEWVNAIGMSVTSDQDSETYRWLAALPAMREWLGGRNVNRLEVHEQIIRNKRWEASLQMSREELRRDKTDQIQLRINELAARASQHWAKLLTDLVEAGATTASYDGANFFSNAHIEGEYGSQDNLLGASAATPASPTAAEMETAIFSALESMLQFKDAGGEPMNQSLSELTIMVPVTMFGAANRALNDGVITDGTGTRTNTLINLGGFNFRLVVNPRLATGGTKFYTFRSDAAIKPYILQQETAPQIEALAEGSDFAFENDAHQYGVSQSMNVGQAVWQYAAETTLS